VFIFRCEEPFKTSEEVIGGSTCGYAEASSKKCERRVGVVKAKPRIGGLSDTARQESQDSVGFLALELGQLDWGGRSLPTEKYSTRRARGRRVGLEKGGRGGADARTQIEMREGDSHSHLGRKSAGTSKRREGDGGRRM